MYSRCWRFFSNCWRSQINVCLKNVATKKKMDEERGRRECWVGLTWEKCRLKVLLGVKDVHRSRCSPLTTQLAGSLTVQTLLFPKHLRSSENDLTIRTRGSDASCPYKSSSPSKRPFEARDIGLVERAFDRDDAGTGDNAFNGTTPSTEPLTGFSENVTTGLNNAEIQQAHRGQECTMQEASWETVPKEREIWDRAGVGMGMGIGGCSKQVHTLVGTREKASISRCDVEK
jgi:hypothetical protein